MRTTKGKVLENLGQNEKLIDETLHLLSTPCVPEGLEDRVQRSVQARRNELAQPTKHHRMSAFKRIMWITTPLTTVAALVVVLMTYRRIDSGHTPPALTAGLASPAPAASLSSPALPHNSILAKEHVTPSRHVREQRTPPVVQKLVILPQTAPQQTSFPAPPAPLTEQEKLLLAMARRSEISSTPEAAFLLISETVIQHGLAPEPPLLASSTTLE